MAVPKRRVSHARAAKRRTHYKVSMKAPIKCKKCGSFKMPHRVCASCGEY